MPKHEKIVCRFFRIWSFGFAFVMRHSSFGFFSCLAYLRVLRAGTDPRSIHSQTLTCRSLGEAQSRVIVRLYIVHLWLKFFVSFRAFLWPEICIHLPSVVKASAAFFRSVPRCLRGSFLNLFELMPVDAPPA